MIKPVKNLNGLSPIEDWIQQCQYMEQEKERWRLALESLTPGGSEFYNDVDYCLAYVNKKVDSIHKSLKKQVMKYKTHLATHICERI